MLNKKKNSFTCLGRSAASDKYWVWECSLSKIPYDQGALSIFNQNVQFEFKATSRSEWNSIFQNFQREANLARCTQIFGNFFPKVFFPFNFAPGISRIFGLVIRISQIQQFLWFLETFPQNVCTICHCFQILVSLVEWKAPRVYSFSLLPYFSDMLGKPQWPLWAEQPFVRVKFWHAT